MSIICSWLTNKQTQILYEHIAKFMFFPFLSLPAKSRIWMKGQENSWNLFSMWICKYLKLNNLRSFCPDCWWKLWCKIYPTWSFYAHGSNYRYLCFVLKRCFIYGKGVSHFVQSCSTNNTHKLLGVKNIWRVWLTIVHLLLPHSSKNPELSSILFFFPLRYSARAKFSNYYTKSQRTT